MSDEKAVNSTFVFFHVLTVTVGMFQFGYTISSFNSIAQDFFYFNNWDKGSLLNTWGAQIVTTCTNTGAMTACLCAPSLMGFGKWRMILATNIVVIVGAGVCMVNNFYVICIGRFILGMSAGAFTVFVPKFVNELSPVEMKGFYGSIN
jgi:MFS family permease